MPLYDVKCFKCSKEFEASSKVEERNSIKCSCGGSTEILLSTQAKDWFRPHLNEGFAEEPIFVESKRHYRELCRRHGVYARCLM